MTIDSATYDELSGTYQLLLETADEVCRHRTPDSGQRLRATVTRLGDLIQRVDPRTTSTEEILALGTALQAARDQLEAAAADFQPNWRHRLRHAIGLQP